MEASSAAPGSTRARSQAERWWLPCALFPLLVLALESWPRAAEPCAFVARSERFFRPAGLPSSLFFSQPSAFAEHLCREGPGALRGPDRLLFGGRLDLRRVSARELVVIPGIGPKRALEILGEQERVGFDRVEDVLRVRGIGPSRLSQLQQRVELRSR